MRYFLTFVFAFVQIFSLAQLTIRESEDIQNLVKTLVGQGIDVSKITFNGQKVNNSPLAGGFVDNINDNNAGFGINEGIVISTLPGKYVSRSGTNFPVTEYFMMAPTNPIPVEESDLMKIVGEEFTNIHDVAVLEFDFIPAGSEIEIKFVFASDEYDDYVCSVFNDAFGFFLSGPGINGKYSNNAKNIALIPNSNIEIAINTVNRGVPGSENTADGCKIEGGGSGLDNDKYFVTNLPANLSVSEMLFQGFTVPITAKSEVICGEKYHIKLAIGDVGDGHMNSAIFLEKESFKSADQEIRAKVLKEKLNGVFEGCENITIKIERKDSTKEEIVFLDVVGGSAKELEDFSEVPWQLLFAKGVKSQTFVIDIFEDNIPEGTEDVQIRAFFEMETCKKVIVEDTVKFKINDFEKIELNDRKICSGDSVQLLVNTGETFIWNPRSGLSDPNIMNPFASPNQTTTYTVTVSNKDGTCFRSGVITVNVSKIEANAGSDISVCRGGEVQLNGEGGTWYFWEPNTSLNNQRIKNPVSTPDKTIIYTLTVKDSDQNCEAKDEVKISVEEILPDFIVNPVCLGETSQFINLTKENGFQNIKWSWDFGDGNFSENKSPTNKYLQPGFFSTVLRVNSGSCSGEIRKTMEIFENPVAGFSVTPNSISGQNSIVKCIDQSIGATIGTWNFGDGIIEKYLKGEIKEHKYWINGPEKDYIIQLIVENDNGCLDTAIQAIVVDNNWAIYFPNSFTPNGDNLNDTFLPYGHGISSYKLEIYNRWGEIIFQSNNFNFGWNGKSKEGFIIEGVYVWNASIINSLGKTIHYMGYVSLLK